MPKYEPGRIAESLSGHDKGRYYVILRTEEDLCYLTDGASHPVRKAKKKKIMHLMLRGKKEERLPVSSRSLSDEAVALFLQQYRENVMH